MSRADRRRRERPAKTSAVPAARAASGDALAALVGGPVLVRAAILALTAILLVVLWRAIEARITWYLAVDQFGYLQFANDLLRGKIFHDWEPARIIGLLPERTDVLSQTYVWDGGRMYCRYSPGFPMLVAAWLGVFGPSRIAFLNPTIFLSLLCVVAACQWRLSGSAWRGVVTAALVALCPTMMYWWSLTLTRDLSAHLFALTGLFLLLPARGARLGIGRAVAVGAAVGFAGSIRNDAILYLVPATLLAVSRWIRERPDGRRTATLVGAATAGLVLGLLPTLSYNAVTTGNPFRPTQGMELKDFLPATTPEATTGGARVAYPSVWKGGTVSQVQGGGLRLAHFPTTAPLQWGFVKAGYGWALLALAAVGAATALVLRPQLFLFTVPYAVTAFLFYSCWSRPDRRYIIGIYTMIPFLVTEGLFGAIDLVRAVARRRGDAVARPIAIGVTLAALGLAVAPIPLPPGTPDASFLSKGVIQLFAWFLPLATALGAAAAAMWPRERVTRYLAPALAVVLVAFAVQRAGATRLQRAPFQGPQARAARENLRKLLEPRAVVITSEDMGRPAENIEYYGGVPALYLTDLDRWRLKASIVALAFITNEVRPYLLVDPTVPERARALADLAAGGFLAEKVTTIPPARNMEHFIATPFRRDVSSELFRISHPALEAKMDSVRPKPR